MRVSRMEIRLITAIALMAIGSQVLPGATPLKNSPRSAMSPEVSLAGFDEQFSNPPASASPWTFWLWVNGNISKEGILADLEDMKRVGIIGAMIFNASMYIPPGPVRYWSDSWHEHIQYAIATADELGLQVGVMNCAGWATAGGPWISLEQSMKKLVWSRQTIPGETKWKGKLPKPPIFEDYYRDVAVFALPEPEVQEPASIIISGKVATFFYNEPVECRLLTILGKKGNKFQGIIEISNDGESFSPLSSFRETRINWPMPIDIPFSPTSSRCFRVTMKKSQIEKGMLKLSNSDRLAHLPSLIGVRPTSSEVQLAKDSLPIGVDQVLDISKMLQKDGTLEWKAPPGNWTVLRFGYTTTGAHNHPASPEGTGLEVDKFDADAVSYHFKNGLGRIIRESGEHLGRSLTTVVSDSWEAGPQTWTKKMPELFTARRGYAMRPYMACLAGYIIGSSEETAAFLHDFRSTMGDLYADSYYGTMARLAHENDMLLMAEGYGGILDEFKLNAVLDIPAVEFWNHDLYKSCGKVPSVAHTTGKNIVMAEAFTSRPPYQCRWKETPFMLKPLGDQAYATGVNQFVLHSYVHQPRSDIAPGFTHGRYGTQFGRLNSWWPLAQGWIDYLRRCQFALQAGLPVADFLCLAPEKLQKEGRDLNFPWPEAYKGDYLSVNQLSALKVKDGLMQIGKGGKYRVLLLPENWPASIATILQLKRLHKAGAKIYGPRPSRPSGLIDATTGYVSWNNEVNEWPFLAQPQTFDFLPDFSSDQKLLFNHRVDQETDIFFVSNPIKKSVDVNAKFRVSDRSPELWDPSTGGRLPNPSYKMSKSQTNVQFSLDPNGSVFVIFRKLSSMTSYKAPSPSNEKSVPVNGPWQVTFQKNRGAPKSVKMNELKSLSENPDLGIRYFSGLAEYSKKIEVPQGVQKCSIDLGEVFDMAEIKVNGKSAGILWKPPFIVDITSLIQPGENEVKVTVANRWVNRLIGDEQLPSEANYLPTSLIKGALTEFPQWWNNIQKPRIRTTFSTWKHYSSEEPLVQSGLVGPVRLLAYESN